MDNMRLSDDRKSIFIVDQTLLPNELKEIRIRTAKEMFEAIFYLKIRGAPAIGIFAGYCLYILAGQSDAKDASTLLEQLKSDADYLNSSRPTAVNLGWALRRMLAAAEKAAGEGGSVDAVRERMYEESVAIHEEDKAMCMAITEYGLSLIDEGDGILTHCNAGALATSKYGTAQGPFILGAERGRKFRVFADETRPLLQGARLTSYELSSAGVDVTLICDNMASIVMKNGWVQKCFVGCDRIAANGDVANKIGTSGVAILAKYYGIPVYSLGPTSTIDLSCKTGDDIKIELRDPNEIKTMFYQKPMAPENVKCYNPAFDVTDHTLLAGIVTEKGICRPPFTDSLKALFE